MKPGRYERRVMETTTQVIRTNPDGAVDVLREHLAQCCANCVHGVLWKNVYQDLSCKISGDAVTDNWHCNAYEESVQ